MHGSLHGSSPRRAPGDRHDPGPRRVPAPRRGSPGRFRRIAGPIALAAGALSPTACAPARAPVAPWPGFGVADTVRITPLAPGVRHVYAWLREGPWAVHVVEVDQRVCTPAIAAVKAGPPLEARAFTHELGAESVAAINADFFMTPAGTPVGAHVRAGRVLVGPGDRPVYALTPDGRHWAGMATLVGWIAVPGDTVAVSQVNRPVSGDRHHPPRPGLTLFDAWYGPRAPPDTSGPTLRLRRLARPGLPGPPGEGRDPAARAARPALAVVVSVDSAGESPDLDPGHLALQATGPAARSWIRRRAAGDTVAWRVALGRADEPGVGALEAVGGFPRLVARGRGVLAEQTGVIESFGPTRHPRTAVAWDTAGDRLLWVVVDGRQPPYSVGMTLAELERLLLRLGATDGINLDGGGSTTMVVRGAVANRPSEAEGERPVGSALVLDGCR